MRAYRSRLRRYNKTTSVLKPGSGHRIRPFPSSKPPTSRWAQWGVKIWKTSFFAKLTTAEGMVCTDNVWEDHLRASTRLDTAIFSRNTCPQVWKFLQTYISACQLSFTSLNALKMIQHSSRQLSSIEDPDVVWNQGSAKIDALRILRSQCLFGRTQPTEDAKIWHNWPFTLSHESLPTDKKGISSSRLFAVSFPARKSTDQQEAV